MKKQLSEKALKIIRKMQQNELCESVIYEKISRFAKGEENKRNFAFFPYIKISPACGGGDLFSCSSADSYDTAGYRADGNDHAAPAVPGDCPAQ
mgnify:CR=1 FL=1